MRQVLGRDCRRMMMMLPSRWHTYVFDDFEARDGVVFPRFEQLHLIPYNDGSDCDARAKNSADTVRWQWFPRPWSERPLVVWSSDANLRRCRGLSSGDEDALFPIWLQQRFPSSRPQTDINAQAGCDSVEMLLLTKLPHVDTSYCRFAMCTG